MLLTNVERCKRIYDELKDGMILCEPNQTYIANDSLFYVEEGELISYIGGAMFCSILAHNFYGFINVYYPTSKPLQKVYALPQSKVYRINAKQAARLLSRNHDNHENIIYFLSSNLHAIGCQFIKIKNEASYTIVKDAIEYYSRNQSSLSRHITLSRFLIDFTGLSRSWIMQTLKELRKGEYIQTSNPEMDIILKKLPRGF
ncbi:helix-turn-helix domain-containing protein [Lelliottia nimipressuralis]